MEPVEFTLRGEFIELHKLLKLQGLTESGGSAKQLVADGAVRVDGQVETRKACKIRAGQLVEVDDLQIRVVGSADQ